MGGYGATFKNKNSRTSNVAVQLTAFAFILQLTAIASLSITCTFQAVAGWFMDGFYIGSSTVMATFTVQAVAGWFAVGFYIGSSAVIAGILSYCLMHSLLDLATAVSPYLKVALNDVARIVGSTCFEFVQGDIKCCHRPLKGLIRFISVLARGMCPCFAVTPSKIWHQKIQHFRHRGSKRELNWRPSLITLLRRSPIGTSWIPGLITNALCRIYVD